MRIRIPPFLLFLMLLLVPATLRTASLCCFFSALTCFFCAASRSPDKRGACFSPVVCRSQQPSQYWEDGDCVTHSQDSVGDSWLSSTSCSSYSCFRVLPHRLQPQKMAKIRLLRISGCRTSSRRITVSNLYTMPESNVVDSLQMRP